MSIQLKPLNGTAEQIGDLQRVFEEAPAYSLRITGQTPGPAEAQSALTALPPGMGYGDKFVFGIYHGERMVGCIDLVRGYPNRKTAMLGLLLLSEKFQRKGLGKEAYSQVEGLIRRWAGVETIRIGVVGTNDPVIPFWKKMGFEETGEKKPYRTDGLESESIVFEKKIVSVKSRYSMRAKLKPLQIEPRWESLPLRIENGEALGILMEKAYRNTIDDEGETVAQFIAEAKETLADKWGKFQSDTSFSIWKNEEMVCATVVTVWKEKPLLAYSVTRPDCQGQGMASQLIKESMNTLHRLGYQTVDLGVTRGNTSAESLYRKLGFVSE